ncbi:MAG: chemotaxis protein CheW [Treponema sp.]|nr:chemotaxis protein CheW [Treponema sp.]MBQ7166786.1 chemotaxis protein CheW [Treponema sp.]
MATIQDKLKAFASTTEQVGGQGSLSQEELKMKNAVTDYSMVAFSLAGKDYAIDIMKVKERAKAGNFTYVPNSLPFVLGVYNLRGDIIPVIDLRLFFNIDMPPREDGHLENMLIIVVGEQTFGVVVDEIDRVVNIQKSAIQPPHPLFGDINIKYIYGVVESDSNLYVLLDIERIFGVHSPEEEKELADTAKAQMMQRQIEEMQMNTPAQSVSSNVVSEGKSPLPSGSKSQSPAQKAPAASQNGGGGAPKAVAPAKEEASEADLKFIADSLQSLTKFSMSPLNTDWIKKRYIDWRKDKGKDKTQIQNEKDALAFLEPFYSESTGDWWSEAYAGAISKALPDNAAKNIVLWNPGCAKGYEAYSLACILKKRYPSAHIRIYAHDTDLLSVSNAPLLAISPAAAKSWYASYLSTTASGENTFDKDIKDMIMFEYHDIANTNSLPDIDIIFARDVLSFLPEANQGTILGDFKEKLKGNGVIIVGSNEDISSYGFKKKLQGNVAVYSK